MQRVKREMDFKVIATSRGFPCIVLGSYKYRKIRETAAGEIVWRCTKKSCLAQVRTNLEQTEVRNLKDEHDHVGLEPIKLKKLLAYDEFNQLLRDSFRYSINRNLEHTLEDSSEVPQQVFKPVEQNTSTKKNATQLPQQPTKQSATKNVQPVSPPPPISQPPPEVCLRWNSHLTNMQLTFSTLLSTEQFVDVTLACEGRSIRCHKIILSACSSYFEELLSQNPCQHPIILMKDLKFWEIEALVDFMYKGEVNVGQDKLPSLLSAAEALQIKGLAGPLESQEQETLMPTAPLEFEDHTDESTTSSFTSHGAKKRKSVPVSLPSTVSQPQSSASRNRSLFSQSRRESPEPSTSSYHTQEESSYEPPPRRTKHYELPTLRMEDIKIEPLEVDPEPDDCFDIKEIDDGGGEPSGAQVFEEIVIPNSVDCVTVKDPGKNI